MGYFPAALECNSDATAAIFFARSEFASVSPDSIISYAFVVIGRKGKIIAGGLP